MQDITEVCCADDACKAGSFIPDTCSVECAYTYIAVFEACEDSITNLPEGQEMAGFYNLCAHAISDGDVCEDDPSWMPGADGCVNSYDIQIGTPGQMCDDLITSGYSCDVQFAAGGDYAGYCDKSCNACDGKCTAMFGVAGTDRCKCDTYSGIHHCPQACNGFCRAAGPNIKQVTDIMVDRGTKDGSIDDACAPNSGRHQWFQFHAEIGIVYKIYTELVAGGLTSTYLHLHATDADQTKIADAVSWHCDDATTTPGAACIMWACTATGDYAVRVQQFAGAGAFKVGVSSKTAEGPVRTLEQVTADAGLRISYQAKPVESAGPFPTPNTLTGLGDFHADFGVDCQLVYCDFTKGGQKLIADGENFMMSIQAVTGVTYKFTSTLGAGSSALYIRTTVVPKNSMGGAGSYDGNDKMQKEVVLGQWEDKADGDNTYHEFNSMYDMKQYKSFPGEADPTSDYFSWVAPGNGEYYVVFTANCDVPILDDVEANMDMTTMRLKPGHDGAMACHADWALDLHIEDMSVTMVLPIISMQLPCVSTPGSACQRQHDRDIEQTALPVVHTARRLQPLPVLVLTPSDEDLVARAGEAGGLPRVRLDEHPHIDAACSLAEEVAASASPTQAMLPCSGSRCVHVLAVGNL